MRFVRFVSLFVILGSVMLAAQSKPSLSQRDSKTQGKILDTYGKLPLSFEENRGQADAQVKFLSRGNGYTLFLTDDEAVLSLRGSKANGEALSAGPQFRPTVVPTANAVLRMKLRDANHTAKMTGIDELPGKSNYFIGNDPKKWRSNVTTFAEVKYEGIYPGIDLVYYGNQRQLEYDFVVAPGANPHRIEFDVRGAKSISRDDNGDLVLQTTIGEVRWRKPLLYQESNGKRHDIVGRYLIRQGHRVGFELATYDPRKALVIDPALGYSTYLGGSGLDYGSGIAVDAVGNVYVTGQTTSVDFPITPGAFQTQCGGGCANNTYDAFVTKVNATGSALIYSTYLGGSATDYGFRIALDSSGDAYVAGVMHPPKLDTKGLDFC